MNLTAELPRLMIVGHGQHGKDSFADYLCEATYGRFSKWSSSLCAAEEALLPHVYKYFPYSKAEQYHHVHLDQGKQKAIDLMYGERSQFRPEWKQSILDYNTPDRTRLMRKLYEKCNVYVGIRSSEEFEAGKREKLFDYSIWVEDPRKPPEASCHVRKEQCQFFVENNGDKEDLKRKAELMAGFINPDYVRPL